MPVIVSHVTQQALCTLSVRRTGTDELFRRFVLASGARAEANAKRLGVCPSKSTTDDEVVPVIVEGVALVEAGAAIALPTNGMAPVQVDGDGRAITHTGNNPVAGLALQAATEAEEAIAVLLAIPDA